MKDANGVVICWVYERPNDGMIGNHKYDQMPPDLARRVAANIARLPGLLGAKKQPAND